MLSPSSSRTFVRIVFVGLTLLLASLLTARYKLEAPYDRPYGKPINLGHQANQVAFSRTPPKENVEAGGTELGAETTDSWADEDDWDLWGMSSMGDKAKNGWDPLESSTTPFTELQVKTCVLSPGLYDLCSPTSSAKEDATRGKWERIDKDLSKRIGVYYLYIYARRLLPGSDAPVITDIRLLNHTATTEDLSDSGTWVEVSTSLREGVWPRMTPLFLHYKLTPQSDVFAARKAEGANGSAGDLQPITELDVLYGGKEVHPLPGFTRIEQMVTGGPDDAKAIGTGYGKGTRVGASLAYRKENKQLPTTPVLRFSNAGNFTILQIADLHFSVGPGACRDLDWKREAECKQLGADVYSLKWLETALEEVKPDLVVLSGDQLNGQETSWDAQSVILKWAPLLYERGIPWTVVFGNHDEEETTLAREGQMNLMRHLPLFMGEAGPSSVAGIGNYVRSIRSPSAAGDDVALFNMYFLDSHANVRNVNPWAKPSYDYLKPDQINWFRGRSAQMKTYTRPYAPPRQLTTTNRVSSNRRPGRPKKKPARPAAGSNGGRRLVRLTKRQEEGSLANLNEEWEQAGVQELQELEKEMKADAEAEFGLAGDDESLTPAVEPYDGSEIVDNPDDDISFESSASKSDGQTETVGIVSADRLEEAEEEMLAEEGWLEPTVLPAGPSKASPMEAKPNAMVFMHIPLQQAYSPKVDVSPSGKRLRIGERLEGDGASKTDSGFWQQGVLAQGELPAPRGEGDAPVDAFWDGEAATPTTGRPEVKVVAHGHCHITSDCRRIDGVWICFGAGATYSGYGNSTFTRRMRVYQLSDFGERIETWQLTDEKERVNHAVLVGDGSIEQQ
ncbi:Phosphatase dcr2 [Rhodotorula toruloides]